MEVVIKYVWLFFFCTGLALNTVYKKQQRGEDTWETRHNIVVRKWWGTACMTLGVVVLIVTSFIE